MKKFLFAAAVILLCGSFGWAQQQGDQSSGAKAQMGTVRGCLGGSAGNYTLTQDQSGTMFRLVGNDDQLKMHMGHEVLVTGQLPDVGTAPSVAGEAQSDSSANGASGSSTSGNIIQVSTVRMISKSCPSAAGSPSSY